MKRRIFNAVLTLALVAVAAFAAWRLYHSYLDTPWTRDCQVRANVVGIAPRVAGPVTLVRVTDNQAVKKGDLLFEIDPTDYQAKLDVVKAAFTDAQASLTQKEQDSEGQKNLYERKVAAIAEFESAQNALASARSQVASAQASVNLAQLNLEYTRITSPVDGLVTNMNVSPGTYVNVGERLTALVDTGSYWIAAYFKETQLPAIRTGQKARVTLLGADGPPLEGEVISIGWGIHLDDGSASASALLPTVNQTVDWVRDCRSVSRCASNSPPTWRKHCTSGKPFPSAWFPAKGVNAAADTPAESDAVISHPPSGRIRSPEHTDANHDYSPAFSPGRHRPRPSEGG